jgi:hypothetical protein
VAHPKGRRRIGRRVRRIALTLAPLVTLAAAIVELTHAILGS